MSPLELALAPLLLCDTLLSTGERSISPPEPSDRTRPHLRPHLRRLAVDLRPAPTPVMGSPLSPLAMLPALAFFLSPSSSTRTTPSRRSGSSFFARDNPPPRPASTTARRASGQQHQHYQQHQLELERRTRQPQPPPAPAAALDLHLSTNCTACGEPVAVEVPRWILAAMEGAQQQQQQHLLSGPAYREDRGRGAPSSAAAEWRERVVSGAVGAAHAVKASPVRPHFHPKLVLAALC